jgi:hypothetical protein
LSVCAYTINQSTLGIDATVFTAGRLFAANARCRWKSKKKTKISGKSE